MLNNNFNDLFIIELLEMRNELENFENLKLKHHSRGKCV